MPDYNDDAVSHTGWDETLCQRETNVEGEMMRGEREEGGRGNTAPLGEHSPTGGMEEQ